jgi:hypothetical protein
MLATITAVQQWPFSGVTPSNAASTVALHLVLLDVCVFAAMVLAEVILLSADVGLVLQLDGWESCPPGS